MVIFLCPLGLSTVLWVKGKIPGLAIFQIFDCLVHFLTRRSQKAEDVLF